MDYQNFLAGKHVRHEASGFTVPLEQINPAAFPFQRDIVQWALRLGRAALFADCGLGKTLMQLEWGSHVSWHTRRPVLLLCPIAVAEQTLDEHRKFSIQSQARIVTDQSEVGPGINICNYEKLHRLRAESFGGVVLDESSILKNYTGKTKGQLCDSFSATPFRLACTATPAPNDHMEIGNHSEFLGAMRSSEMLSRWFINDTMKAGGYRLRGHGAADFWRWCCSWAVAVSQPSDLGYDTTFDVNLPPLRTVDHVIASPAPAGHLINAGQAVSATNVHREKRAALQGKAERIAALVAAEPGESWAIWVDTDYEADAVLALLPEAVEVRGSMPEAKKLANLRAFSSGVAKVIVTKPEIGGFGLNWQHCRRTAFMVGFSFERWYQAIRRLWRFGQTGEVVAHLILSESEQSVADTLKRKSTDFSTMTREMTSAMRETQLAEVRGVQHVASYQPSRSMLLPSWLSAKA